MPVRRERHRRQLRPVGDLAADARELGVQGRLAPTQPDSEAAAEVQLRRPAEHARSRDAGGVLRRVAVRAPQVAGVRQSDRDEARRWRPASRRQPNLIEQDIQARCSVECVDAARVGSNPHVEDPQRRTTYLVEVAPGGTNAAHAVSRPPGHETLPSPKGLCLRGPVVWARLGLNQRPLACEAIEGHRRKARKHGLRVQLRRIGERSDVRGCASICADSGTRIGFVPLRHNPAPDWALRASGTRWDGHLRCPEGAASSGRSTRRVQEIVERDTVVNVFVVAIVLKPRLPARRARAHSWTSAC